MTYNVGPDFTRYSQGKEVVCDACGEMDKPEWDGYEGEWRCVMCFEPFPNYEEE